MTESQKREAKRLVEILIEMGILGETKTKRKRWISLQIDDGDEFERKVMEAIAMYQAEELAKAWGKLLIQRMERKDKE